MQLDLLWITVALLGSGPVLTLCDPLYLLSAPQVMRVGAQERVFVEVQDYPGRDILDVTIRVMNFPLKDKDLASTSLQLESGSSYQALANITIPFVVGVFDTDKEQYVYLTATIAGNKLEKLVMVSFQSGNLFIQTDKTIYTPDSVVRYRVFSMGLDEKPINSHIFVEIMTPEGIIIKKNQYSLDRVLKSEYKLGNPISPGIWKIVASFKESRYQNFTAEFEVKEYVLPSIEVKLEPEDKTFFQVDDDSFTVNIKARYLFGQEVKGNAFAVFGVLIDNKKKTSLRSSLSKVPIQNGEGKAVLSRKQITDTFPNITELVGKSLYVSVSVITETGSEIVEAERRGIHIVKSPYTIHFTKTPKFFKPGMPFDFMVYVTNPDGTPAGDVVIAIKGDEKVLFKTNKNGIVKMTTNTQKESNTLRITVCTVNSRIQTENSMTAEAYQPKGGSQNYLHIDVPVTVLKVGDPFSFKLNIGTIPGVRNQDFSYMILSKGRIIQASRFVRKGNAVVAVHLMITKEMLPSFRVVAYYHVGTAEVVSDSVWVDVEDTCMGSLELNVEIAPYAPTQEFSLKITGDPGAKVGLVAVDKGVYVLNNKNRLTQKKIWDIVEKNDIGCTAGSGKDSMGVFYDAGLVFQSDKAGGTADRTGYTCPTAPKRKRRQVTKAQLKETLVGKFSDNIRMCCLDGLVENQLGYTCERRAEYVEDGKECRDAFLECCRKIAQIQPEVVEEELLFARNDLEEIDDEYQHHAITSRSSFPESWMWHDTTLQASGNKLKIEETKKQRFPDSITTWVITAISQSPEYGVCVAEPLELRVTKPFFIDLKLPYSTVINEQIEIKAIIHNLNEDEIDRVLVELKDIPGVCSLASFKKRYRTSISIEGKSSKAVSFVIIPLASGQHSIEVTARNLDIGTADRVTKTLKVVSQGVLTSTGEITHHLEPNGGKSTSKINRPILKNKMPGTDAFTYIAVRGRPVSQLMKVAISGEGLRDLIKMPYGCGEQNMMAMVLPMIATDYLDKTNRWDDVGVEQRSTALHYIGTGYTNQLNFLLPTGAFALYRHKPGSTWLTAYVVKMFSKASSLVTIDPDVICNAVRWLILNTQMPDGVFQEFAKTGVASSDLWGKSKPLSMTAFVLIALQEANPICAKDIGSLQLSMNKALRYIESNIATQTDPYVVTMASYALANANKLRRELLFKYASPDASHWPVKEGYLFTLEATGYALLTLLKINELKSATPVMKWLKSKQRYGGTYQSTQATAVVFEGMAKYWTINRPTPGNMDVSVTSTARKSSFTTTFTQSTQRIQRSDRFRADGDLTVEASGDGEGSISVITWFYAMPNENSTTCKNFDLNVQFNKTAKSKDALETYTLSIETKFLNTERESTMTILDIGILTGFTVDTSSLNDLMRSDRYIDKFEMNDQLSERGSLIIYLKKVSNKEHEKIVFRMNKMLDVALPQPVAVTVYEYYANENSCVKFYDTERSRGTLYTLCPTEVCSCAEANCAQLKEPDVPESKERKEEACKQRDFVYKVKLKDVKQVDSKRTYTFTILDVLKDGTDKVSPNDEREFLAHIKCEKYLNLKVGKDYLIMGPEPQRVGSSYRYIFGAQNWVEYWPTSEESQGSKSNQDRYLGMAELVHLLDNFGCTT